MGHLTHGGFQLVAEAPFCYKIALLMKRVAQLLFLLPLLLAGGCAQWSPFIKDSKGLPREAWLDQVGLADDLHRPTSWLVLILVLLTWNGLRDMESPQRKLAHIAVGITLAQMTLGLILENAGLPPVAQTLHLTGAAALVCVAFCLGWPIGKVEKLSA